MAQPKVQLTLLEKREEQHFTLGVVYEPDSVDTQGEYAKASAIESAAWNFMERLQGLAKSGALILKAALAADADGVTLDITEAADVLEKGAGLDDQHLHVGDDANLGTIVESYLAPVDLTIGKQTVKKGAWLLGVKWSPAMWKQIKSGARTGLSMFGRVDRIEDEAA